MPMIGLGTYALRGKTCEHCIFEALDLGYRLFDTAQMYENEQEIGNALSQSNVSRSELFITSKVYRPNTSFAKTKEAIERSLNALQVDYLDLFLIHEPYPQAEEMYSALEEAQSAGKLKAIGISNFNATRYKDLLKSCSVIPAVNQVEAHLFYQPMNLLHELANHGTHLQAWSPLGAGKKDLLANPLLRALSLRYRKTPAQIALRFLIELGISVIPKTSSPSRLKENLEIFDFRLSADDMQRLRSLDTGKSLFGWYD